jgi:hypothetical protein
MTARRYDMTERPGSAGGETGGDVGRDGGRVRAHVQEEVDVLSEVLRAVRLRGAVYFHVSA